MDARDDKQRTQVTQEKAKQGRSQTRRENHKMEKRRENRIELLRESVCCLAWLAAKEEDGTPLTATFAIFCPCTLSGQGQKSDFL